MTQLSDVMRDSNPLMLRPEVTVRRACEEMRKHRATAVLVTDADDCLLGVFTGRDAICRVLADGKNAAKVTLAEVMTEHPVAITPRTTAIEALRVMWDGGFRHLPVTESGNVVGLVQRRAFKSEDLHLLEDERELWEHMR